MPAEPVSRRGFLGNIALAGAAAALIRAPEFLRSGGWLEAAHAQTTDLLHDTFNGLLAFVVPGSDAYSTAQGVFTNDLGGVDSGAIEALIATMDGTAPYFPQFSAIVAGILNGFAQAVNAGASGPFLSPFARLSFAEKAAVFQLLDGGADPLKVIAGVRPGFVAFFVYSEAGSFDPATRSLTGQPVGWAISRYPGVSDGREDFLGYLHGIQKNQ